MTLRRLVLAAALAAGLSAPGALAADAPPPAAADALPGVDLSPLSPEQRQTVLEYAREAFCYCGCPHTLDQCLRTHEKCGHAPRMAALAVRLAKGGARKADLAKAVDAYYGSFEKRAKLDVEKYGPPRGSASAPISLVEFSDFTCPYCQMVHGPLSAWVEARADRVKLFYKPFPIESHPGALETAQAGEWARANGLFWKMHDALFEHPRAHAVDDLADLARGAGGDPADLRAALEEKRFLPKVRASQGEARGAGIRGTPTLFLNGRMNVLSDFSEDGLDFTLGDEEEWQRHRGWEKD
jgi:protein-disulfide isomerase